MVYLPPAFTEARPEVLISHIEWYDFGLLVSHGSGALVASHIPFLVEHGTFMAISHALTRRWPTSSAGEKYWRSSPGRTPTSRRNGMRPVPVCRPGNYIDVHAYGTIRLIEDRGWLQGFLGHLSERHETRNPSPWRMQDLPKTYVRGMLEGIIGLEIAVTRLEGKYKLSQNRPAADRPRVIAALEAQHDADAHAVAQLMREREPA
jgi:transcriptional regulator